MNVVTAQLQESSAEDRIATTTSGVVVLDGATAHDPMMPTSGGYVDLLCDQLRQRLNSPDGLQAILSSAIESTADALQIRPGTAPSSTVAIVRLRHDAIETLLLGDTPIVIGWTDGSQSILTDNRLAALDLPESREYRARLAAGGGYDRRHHDLLTALQSRQRQWRNREDGYWIAEADPTAAEHAIVSRDPVSSVSWIVMATDGAANMLAPLGFSWEQLARLDTSALNDFLSDCHEWEAHHDPDGQLQPRSKRHDDKSVAIVRPSPAHSRQTPQRFA
ncbi:protein phosphatase 2C domain-containing protein [Nocardia sp. alder85J]|uniref:protein phosphatase 2C domain-containing protein n=1 Tax=Nocardia sp. alder85J TaxID=2862949 RepID=UPI001CD7CFDF|nr:protein phosphatase 2C domain-containing protein [Nocardia sp. alder85J]MCX4095078.1 protein phosphatase 2C domain-containing protein [Nocardia sp. alder85J]